MVAKIAPNTTARFRDITRSHHRPFGGHKMRVIVGERIIINTKREGGIVIDRVIESTEVIPAVRMGCKHTNTGRQSDIRFKVGKPYKHTQIQILFH